MALGVALVVGISIGGFLIFSQIAASIQGNVAAAQSAVKNLIAVQSTTPVYHEQVNAPMTEPGLVGKIEQVSGVLAVQRVSYVNFNGGAIVRGGAPPIEGIDVVSGGTLMDVIGNGQAGASPYTIAQGRDLQPSDSNSAVCIIPAGYASISGIGLGQSVQENGTPFTVVGIYSVGDTYANNGGPTIVPYDPALQATLAPGPNVVYVTAATTGSVYTLVGEIQSAIGQDYEVQPVSDLGAVGNDINSIASINQEEEYVSLAVGAIVIGLVTFVVTAQRRREIGLLKLLGFTNGSIVSQLALESMLWSLLGLPIALAVSVLAGPLVLQSVQQSANAGGSGTIYSGSSAHSVSAASQFLAATFEVTPSTLLLAVLVTVCIGLVGAILPILRAARLRPAEAMRA